MQKQIDRVARAVLLAVRAPALLPADFGRINRSAAFCAIHEAGHRRGRHGFAVVAQSFFGVYFVSENRERSDEWPSTR